MARILIVDDERKMTKVLSLLLQSEGHTADTCQSGEEAVSMMDHYVYDIVITDLKMPGIDGMELLSEVKKRNSETEVVMMTAFATTRSAIQAIKSGAYDYLTKPFDNDELLHIVQRILEKQSLVTEKKNLVKENKELRRKLEEKRVVGRGRRMQEIYRLVEMVAPTGTTVLLRGESGTGKELIARMIHDLSPSSKGEFVPVHCAAYPETLLESELFGHEKGAFTGASSRRVGRFERAMGGTLFLDEIGEISPAVQVKLLRVLQERSFERLGGDFTVHTDARIIAATNRNLEQAMEEGLFREDLYYRLSVFPITLPPLRDRPDDLEELTAYFLSKLGGGDVTVSAEVISLFRVYSWPGNVRELENVIERALILAGGEKLIAPGHLPMHLRESAEKGYDSGRELGEKKVSTGYRDTLRLDQMERQLIMTALKRSGGNKSRAAELLGITRRALYSRMERHGIAVDTDFTERI